MAVVFNEVQDQSSQGFCDTKIASRSFLWATGYKMFQDLSYGVVERRKQMDTLKTAKRNKIPDKYRQTLYKREAMAYRQTS